MGYSDSAKTTSTTGCAVSRASVFKTLEDLERAASRLQPAANFAAEVAGRYLGGSELIEAADDNIPRPIPSMLTRLEKLIIILDDAADKINHNLERLME